MHCVAAHSIAIVSNLMHLKRKTEEERGTDLNNPPSLYKKNINPINYGCVSRGVAPTSHSERSGTGCEGDSANNISSSSISIILFYVPYVIVTNDSFGRPSTFKCYHKKMDQTNYRANTCIYSHIAKKSKLMIFYILH